MWFSGTGSVVGPEGGLNGSCVRSSAHTLTGHNAMATQEITGSGRLLARAVGLTGVPRPLATGDDEPIA